MDSDPPHMTVDSQVIPSSEVAKQCLQAKTLAQFCEELLDCKKAKEDGGNEFGFTGLSWDGLEKDYVKANRQQDITLYRITFRDSYRDLLLDLHCDPSEVNPIMELVQSYLSND